MGPLRAILVDDNPIVLRSLGRLLAAIPNVEVVGEATSGRAALALAARLGPDLVLMDMAMPEMDGLEATRRLSIRPGAPRIVMVTMNDLPEYREAARAAGAYDFIAKPSLAEHLPPLIRRILADRERDETGQA